MSYFRFMASRHAQRLLILAVLLLQFALAVGSVRHNAPTMDEQGFLVRGLAYLRNEQRQIRVGHPLGLNALNASLLVLDDAVRLPTQDPSWQGTSFHRPGELFLWEIGNDVAHVMFLARLPTVFLGLLLAAAMGRWAYQLSHNGWAGWLALTLVALDPNLLASSSLTTTDLGLAAAAAWAGYTLWRFLREPGWGRAIVAGAAFGLLQNTKFTAGLFVPLFGLVILVWFIHRWRNPTTRQASRTMLQSPLVQLVVAYPVAGFFTLWACYGFNIGTLPENLPTFSQLSGLTLPLAHHLEQLLDIGGRLQVNTPSFLMGRYSDQGWWYYFPVAFLLKTPLPTLLLLVWAGVVWLRKNLTGFRNLSGLQRRVRVVDAAALLIPPLGYFAIALTTSINLGYRHLLPVLPFLFVFIAATLGEATGRTVSPVPTLSPLVAPPLHTTHHAPRILIPLLLLWLTLATLFIYPHFLSFFNGLAGGPHNGWQYLVDSNIDWGQDLPGLKTWMAENGVAQVWLSYFGEARPQYYNISYTGLDSFPPRLMNPQARPFYPADPAPGFYAISASNLQGVLFRDHDRFAWFREREPIAKVGYSIFIYEVAATGDPVTVALSGIQLDEITPADYALLGTNQVTPVWFEASQSWVSAPDWVVLGKDVSLAPDLQPLWNAAAPTPLASSEHYTLYQLVKPDAAALPYTFLPVDVTFTQAEGTIHLAEWANLTAPAGEMVLLTVWQQDTRPQPTKLFIHLTAPDGTMVAQWDGLGVTWEGWREGVTLYQLHRLAVPDAAAGTYQLWAGLYHPDTLERWTTPAGDRVLLGEITIPAQ